MGKLADLFVKLGLKSGEFNKGIGDAEKRTNKFGSAMKKVGGAIAATFAVGAIARFMKESVRLSDIQAKAENQLLVALKGRRKAQQGLIKQAAELQKVTLFGDEATIQAQALIAAFVKEEDQIKKVIPLVQDLATAKRMDLAAAADLVSKTLGSSTNALSRYGIKVEGTVGSTERLESLIMNLNDAFGGQAEAAAKVGTGALTQLGNTWGDLREAIGGAITQSKIFNTIVNGLRGFIEKLIPSNDTLVQSLEDQRTKLNELAIAFNDPNKKEEDRKKILDEINKIAPDIVKGIEDEGKALEDTTIDLKEYNARQIDRIIIAKEQAKIDDLAAKKNELLIKRREAEVEVIKDLARITVELSENRELEEKYPATVEKVNRVLNSNLSVTEKAAAINKLMASETKLLTLSQQSQLKSLFVNSDAINDYNDANRGVLKITGEVNEAISDREQLEKELGITIDDVTKSVNQATDATKKLNAERSKRVAAPERAGTIGVTGELAPTAEFGKTIDETIPLQLDVLNRKMQENREKAQREYDMYLRDWDEFQQAFSSLAQETFIQTVDLIGDAFGKLIATGKFPKDFGQNILKIIGGFLSQLGKMLIVYAGGIEAFFKAFGLGPLGAPLAFAAGVALVAVGGAISAFASAGPGGTTGGGGMGGGGFAVATKAFTPAMAGAGGGRERVQPIELSAKIQGDNIFLSNSRNVTKRNQIG
jgi:hypothetical protein